MEGKIIKYAVTWSMRLVDNLFAFPFNTLLPSFQSFWKGRKSGMLCAAIYRKSGNTTFSRYSLASLQKAKLFAGVLSGKEGISSKFRANQRTCR
jgi:hypothetical protein